MATAPTTKPSAPRRPRPGLTRKRVIAEALHLVDEEGLEALTMRRLGKRLGVEAMSLYNHVDGKAALEAGIVGLLWGEVERSVDDAGGWRDSLRSLAQGVRGLATEHPNAFSLVTGASSFVEPMLRALGGGIVALREAGFDEARAAKTVNTVLGFAAGYAAMEISCRASGFEPAPGGDELESLVQLTQALPPDAPPELVRIAQECYAYDTGEQFEFGLDALLAGLDPECATLDRR